VDTAAARIVVGAAAGAVVGAAVGAAVGIGAGVAIEVVGLVTASLNRPEAAYR